MTTGCICTLCICVLVYALMNIARKCDNAEIQYDNEVNKYGAVALTIEKSLRCQPLFPIKI